MKTLKSLIIVLLFSCSAFAQESQQQAPPKHPENISPNFSKHECYSVVDGKLMHCTGDKKVVQLDVVTLRNGSTISPDGILRPTKGEPVKLKAGECVTLVGIVSDCEKLHAQPAKDAK